MKGYKKSSSATLSYSLVILALLVFLMLEVFHQYSWNYLDQIAYLIFNPASYLVLLLITVVVIFAQFTRLVSELNTSLRLAIFTKRFLLNKIIIKRVALIALITICCGSISFINFFSEVTLVSNYKAFVAMISLFSITLLFIAMLFGAVIFYVSKYEKSKVEQVLTEINFSFSNLADETPLCSTQLNKKYCEQDFNSFINVYMVNKNIDVLIQINITYAEYWSNLKKSKVPPLAVSFN
ncbi:hypothetical protein [Spiroplasma clarkii]|nr:hypothetical protein [Spiroplasma clarkii]